MNETAEVFQSERDIGFDTATGRLIYVSVRARTNVKLFNVASVYRPLYDSFEAIRSDLNMRNPVGANKVIQTTEDGSWTQLFASESFAINAFYGMILSIFVAFLALTISTRNIVISIFATISIIGVIAGLFLGLVVFGFNFGTAESIAVVVMIGLSVDYTVHLGNGYVESRASTRRGKVTDSLRYLGISVLSGGVTTLGSALPLYGPVVIFFPKFGTMILITIFFSLLWAFAGFMAWCLILGPTGNLEYLWHKWRSRSTKVEHAEMN
eukprot:998481_1